MNAATAAASVFGNATVAYMAQQQAIQAEKQAGKHRTKEQKQVR